MTEHEHEWVLTVDGPDCDICQFRTVAGVAACDCGAVMGPTEIERRLNACEKLSGDKARVIAWVLTRDPLSWEQDDVDALLAFANAREGK